MTAKAPTGFAPNYRNPWALPDSSIAQLIVHAGIAWGAIAETPPRVLANVLEYLGQRNGYKPRPKRSILDASIPHDQLRAMLIAQQGETDV